jgi:DNA-binding FrmR family transcriptional regulator
MDEQVRREAVKRLAYIEGHLQGVRRMVEADAYCVDVLRQTYAIQRALERLEALLVSEHLRRCVPSGIRAGQEEAVLAELAALYGVARRWRTDRPAPARRHGLDAGAAPQESDDDAGDR